MAYDGAAAAAAGRVGRGNEGRRKWDIDWRPGRCSMPTGPDIACNGEMTHIVVIALFPIYVCIVNAWHGSTTRLLFLEAAEKKGSLIS